jgi:hypothetical protein
MGRRWLMNRCNFNCWAMRSDVSGACSSERFMNPLRDRRIHAVAGLAPSADLSSTRRGLQPPCTVHRQWLNLREHHLRQSHQI